MGIPLPITTRLDERSATAQADRAERIFADAGRNAGRQFSDSMSGGLRESENGLKRIANTASDAYDKMRDAAGRTRAEEERLQDLRERGARNAQVVTQAERVEKARRAEARAVRDAVEAYNDYHQSASRAADSSGKFGDSLSGGFRRAAGAAAGAGQEAAEGFMGGFAGASALTRLGAAAGPVGIALTGIAALGLVTGKKFVEQFEIGLASLSMKDTFAARLGVDDATMARYGSAAGQAYTNAWGESVQDNLQVVQFAVQGGLIDRNATDAEIQQIIEQIHTVSAVVGEDAQSIARGVRNFIKTGMVDSTTEALDLVIAASQQGLNISGDLLDSFEEYGTKFRDVGLSGQDALGLINQMWEAGIRNTDVAADALKEFAITAVDGSEMTAQAFAALGFDASEMAQRFSEGGPVARDALGEVLDALNGLDTELQKDIVGTALFKTKWEDAGDAIKGADLDTAASQLGEMEGATQRASDKLSGHSSSWAQLGRDIDQTMSKLREWLADSAIGRFFGQDVPEFLGSLLTGVDASPQGYSDGGPTVPYPGGPSVLDGMGSATGGNPLNPNDIYGVGAAPGGHPFTTPPPLPGAGGPGTDVVPPLARTTPVPMTPDSAGTGGAASDRPNIPLSAYSLDAIPLGGFQGETPGAVPPSIYGNAGIPLGQEGPGYFDVDPQRIFDAETRQMGARTSVEEARRRVLELEASNDATESELHAARNAVAMAERGYLSAQMALAEAQQGTWKKLQETAQEFSEGIGQVGAALDDDLGVSDGLAGIADNLTRFLANLAFAPVLGALKGVQAANGGYDEKTMGSGIFGLAGLSMGMGPSPSTAGAYMPSMVPGAGYGGGQTYGSSGIQPSSMGLAPGVGNYGLPMGTDIRQGQPGFPSWVYQVADAFGLEASTYSGHQEGTGKNKGIDWWPKGKSDMSGQSYNANELANMDSFANYLAQTGMMEQVIWENPQTGRQVGVADGQRVGPGTSQPGYYGSDWDDHEGHIHSRQSSPIPLPRAATPGIPASSPLMAGGGGAGTGAVGPGLAGLPQAGPLGGPFGPMSGPAAPSQSVVGGRAFGQDLPASSGIGIGGGLIGMAGSAISGAAGLAASGAAMGMDGGMGGAAASAVAQIGIQQIQRAISAGGQYAGALAGGVLETFSLNDSALGDPSRSWLGRLMTVAAGVRPALPNTAGKEGGAQNPNMAEAGKQPPGPLSPQQVEEAKAADGQGQGGGTTNTVNNNVNVTNQGATEDYTGQVIQSHLGAQAMAGAPR